jgi:hypothetical protein
VPVNGFGRGGQRTVDERNVSERRGGHENIELTAALDQAAQHGRIFDGVLRRGRDMIDVARVDLSAAVEHEIDDFWRARTMQRELAVRPACVHELRVGR